MAARLSAQTVDIADGAVSAAVTGAFLEPYEVAVTPSWVTDRDVRDKTAAGFTVDFAVSAPAGAVCDVIVRW